jgi:hypothetical protein
MYIGIATRPKKDTVWEGKGQFALVSPAAAITLTNNPMP